MKKNKQLASEPETQTSSTSADFKTTDLMELFFKRKFKEPANVRAVVVGLIFALILLNFFVRTINFEELNLGAILQKPPPPPPPELLTEGTVQGEVAQAQIRPPAVNISVFRDANNNGVKDSGENPPADIGDLYVNGSLVSGSRLSWSGPVNPGSAIEVKLAVTDPAWSGTGWSYQEGRCEDDGTKCYRQSLVSGLNYVDPAYTAMVGIPFDFGNWDVMFVQLGVNSLSSTTPSPTPSPASSPRPIIISKPSPTPGTVFNNRISWRTPQVSLTADDFYIIADGKKFLGSTNNLFVHSDPGNSGYTTLEVGWRENGVPMGMNMYFRNENGSWYVSEFRTYDGKDPGDWIFYDGFAGGLLGQPLIKPIFDQQSKVASFNQYSGSVHFRNLRLQPFLNQTINASPTPIPSPIDGRCAGPLRIASLTSPVATNGQVVVRVQTDSGFCDGTPVWFYLGGLKGLWWGSASSSANLRWFWTRCKISGSACSVTFKAPSVAGNFPLIAVGDLDRDGRWYESGEYDKRVLNVF